MMGRVQAMIGAVAPQDSVERYTALGVDVRRRRASPRFSARRSSGLSLERIASESGGTKFRPVSHMGLAGRFWGRPCAKSTTYQRITDCVTRQDFDPLV